jgi:disulfide bond formation protein DsbB
MQIPIRAVFAGIVVICAALLAAAILYFQNELGLEPCPMCILSRVCFMAIGAIAFVAAIHGPRGRAPRVYASLIALFGAIGVGISMRHSYLQHFPPAVESCGADLGFMLNTLPIAQALPKIFAGTGSCSEAAWKFLGLSIPEWAGVWFVAMSAAALYFAFRRRA